MPTTPYIPSWKKYERDLTSEDSKKAMAAGEAFDEQRKKETASSKKARDWENDRKNSILKAKPEWKRKQNKAEKEKLDAITAKLREFGSHTGTLNPAPGYLVVKVEEKETKTESGIYVAGSDLPDNSGYVVGVGGGQLLTTGHTVNIPCRVGDNILYKRGAGVEIELEVGKCKLMQFSDVLGVFK